MKAKIILSTVLAGMVLSLASFAHAGEIEERGGPIEEGGYRCEAIGRSERGWVSGEATSPFLKEAEIGALRDCREKGGMDCRINHCFR